MWVVISISCGAERARLRTHRSETFVECGMIYSLDILLYTFSSHSQYASRACRSSDVGTMFLFPSFFSFFSFFRSFKSLEEILLLSFRSFTHYNCTLGDYHVVLWSNYESRTAICHIIANKASKHSSSLLAVSLVCGDGVFFFRSPHNSRTVNNWVNSCYILFWIHTAHLQLWSGRELFQLQLRYCLACALSVSLSCFFFLIIIWWCLDSLTDALWCDKMKKLSKKQNNNRDMSHRLWIWNFCWTLSWPF